MKSSLFYLLGAVILTTAFLTLLVFGDDEIPQPKRDPAAWVQAMHSARWVEFMMSEVANRQVRGDKVVLDEVSRCLPGTDALGRSSWVFMAKFHRQNSATETAMITLTPIPTRIEIVIFSQPNL